MNTKTTVTVAANVLLLLAVVGTFVAVAASYTVPAGYLGSHADSQSYGERLAERHGCDGEGLPTGVVLTYRDSVAAEYVTDPAVVSAAFEAALGERPMPKSIYSVTAFCA